MFFCSLILSCYSYKKGDPVKIFSSKIAPRNNPSITYSILNFPYCFADKNKAPKGNFEDRIIGDEMFPLNIPLKFGVNEKEMEICSKVPKHDQTVNAKKAAFDNYWIRYYIDDIPIYAHLSTFREGIPMFFTHFSFTFFTNGPNIIDINLSMSSPIDINENEAIYLTYSTKWQQTKIEKKNMFDRRHEEEFFEHSSHKYAAYNSSFTALMLFILMAIVLAKTLSSRSDKYQSFEGIEMDSAYDYGWRMLYGDVFRPPSHKTLISVISGCGCQLLATLIFYCILNKFSCFYQMRHGCLTMFVVCFVLMTPVAGYFSVVFAKVYGEQKWLRVALMSGLIMPIFVFFVAILISINGIVSGTTKYAPILEFIKYNIILLVFSLPLSAFGGTVGAKSQMLQVMKFEIGLVPRVIPEQSSMCNRYTISLIEGFVVAVTTLIEYYYILASVWEMKLYYIWGYALTFAIVLIVSSMCVSVIGLYNILQHEDYHWQWPSFVGPATTGLFFFVYSFYFYRNKLEMEGKCQFIDFTLVSASLCVIISLICGGAGYLSGNIFIHKIYQNTKVD